MSSEKDHQEFMRHCLTLAYRGKGLVSPNPMVGAAIVHQGEIIGEGYHERFGESHAEVAALKDVKDRSLLQDSTLYVNLEPCSHHGKTPPCADAILQAKIPTVIIGMTDPNPRVAGQGIQKLQDSGVTVQLGVLEDESQHLNRRFITNQEAKRPYIILKWAETSDGFIAHGDGSSKWISSEESRERVHQMRAEEDAVLVGTKTALLDNPKLTHRTEQYTSHPQPTRIFLDRELSVPKSHHLYDGETKTLCITAESSTDQAGVEFLHAAFNESLWESVLPTLLKRDIGSVIIEGGTKTLQSFIERELWDEAWIFRSKASFGAGIQAPELRGGPPVIQEEIGGDALDIYFRAEGPLFREWL